MTDAFLDSLRDDWQALADQAGAAEDAFARRRLRARLSLAGSALGLIVVICAFVVLAVLAFRDRDMAQIVAALAFTAALPLLMFGFVEQARDMKLIAGMNPEETLRLARQQAAGSLHRLWGARACAAILLAAAAALVISAAVGAVDLAASAFVVALWMVTAVSVWIWQRWRRARLMREIRRCDQMIAEFEAGT